MREASTGFAARLGIGISLVEYKRRFGQLFPEDNQLSPLMLRLMIIRDDLDFEIQGIVLRDEDDAERVWQHTYFLRSVRSANGQARPRSPRNGALGPLSVHAFRS
jgi:hypothetical protein